MLFQGFRLASLHLSSSPPSHRFRPGGVAVGEVGAVVFVSVILAVVVAGAGGGGDGKAVVVAMPDAVLVLGPLGLGFKTLEKGCADGFDSSSVGLYAAVVFQQSVVPDYCDSAAIDPEILNHKPFMKR